MNTDTFPFAMTKEMEDAVLDHAAFCRLGLDWLHRNDPDGHQEEVFLENARDIVSEAARQHFGDDEDAYYEFEEAFEMDQPFGGLWWDILNSEFVEEAA